MTALAVLAESGLVPPLRLLPLVASDEPAGGPDTARGRAAG
jgi:hypothetical protein